MSRRARTVVLCVLAVLFAAGWWQFGRREVPAGQPPLVTLDAQTIHSLRAQFNESAGATRLFVLLSPN